MKYEHLAEQDEKITVALFTRAWIEIAWADFLPDNIFVALFTRAWIEMSIAEYNAAVQLSPSSRGRGLKYNRKRYALQQ